jgi:hypothetical protein
MSTLRDVVRSFKPMGDFDQEIGAVLAVGELAGNHGFMTLLRTVLFEEYVNADVIGDFDNLFPVPELGGDPAFAGSRATALAALEAKMYAHSSPQKQTTREL